LAPIISVGWESFCLAAIALGSNLIATNLATSYWFW